MKRLMTVALRFVSAGETYMAYPEVLPDDSGIAMEFGAVAMQRVQTAAVMWSERKRARDAFLARVGLTRPG